VSDISVLAVEGWTLVAGVGGNSERRVRDVQLGERLGYKNPSDIRQVIDRNREEIEAYGVLPQVEEKPERGGRPAKFFFLNEEQALLVSMFSGASRAPEVRRALIGAFKIVKALAGQASYLESRILEFEKRRDWDLLWGTDVVAAICKLYRWPTHNANGTMYAPLAMVFDRLYRLFLGDVTVAAIKARNPEPSRGKNHHQLLHDKVREMVGSDVSLVKSFADMSATPADWWAKLRTHFKRDPYQLSF
jgi:hypothetical protein